MAAIFFNKLGNTDEAAIRWLARLDMPDLSDRDKQAFYHWLNSSEKHQAAYLRAEQLSSRSNQLQNSNNLELLFNGEAQGRSSADGLSVSATKGKALISFGLPAWQSWALSCSIMLMGVAVLFNVLQANDITSYHYQTAVGELQSHTLADGSTVWLNTATELSIELGEHERKAYLKKGEALFDVRHRDGQSFEVYTDSGVVQVLGTKFSVYYDNRDATVTVLEGKVALGFAQDENASFEHQQVLLPNQSLTFQAVRDGEQPKTVDAKSVLSWRNKRLSYQGVALELVVKDLNRYFDEEITMVDDDAFRQMPVTANFRVTSVDEAVYKLAVSLDLDVSVSDAGQTHTLAPRGN
ncbi:MAG: hypothetical protein COA42_15365 [Alteromonadaceae bacterium]|nr:MAG: hypothetical protein COA42_15365 [Alteromonadaceae bacterium]